MQTSGVRHAVDYADANEELVRLRVDVTRPERLAGERLEVIHRILGKRSPVVATVFLLFLTTVKGNCINHAVTLRRTVHIRWPMSGALVWRIRRNSTACRNGRMAWLGVVGTVTADIDLFVARNLVEQLSQSVTVSHIPLRHQRSTHLTRIRVEHEMDFTPRAPLRVAVLAATLPPTFAIDLQTRAVDRRCCINRT
ncbi:MAG: hypothetical protein E5299_01569 [Burkholderia gladioli]|nr:MAG: hypothetical protein E5299_01569 [Burkholderia gladioli]